jgi:hypothetical protein
MQSTTTERNLNVMTDAKKALKVEGDLVGEGASEVPRHNHVRIQRRRSDARSGNT